MKPCPVIFALAAVEPSRGRDSRPRLPSSFSAVDENRQTHGRQGRIQRLVPITSQPQMRNPVACVSCRNAKQKCIHRDKPPCDRCQAAGKADTCRFPPPGTSSIHRQSKRRRLSSHQSSANHANGAAGQRASPAESSVLLAFPNGLDTSLADVDPFNLLTDEVKKSYLRCSYKWCFHHTPTWLNRVIEKSLDSWISWSILALAVR